MIVGILTLELLLNGCRSLKDKRQILNGLKNRLRNNFNVSVAEIDFQDKWQRAMFGIACVGCDKQFVNTLLDKAADFVGADSEIVVAGHSLEIL